MGDKERAVMEQEEYKTYRVQMKNDNSKRTRKGVMSMRVEYKL